MKTTFRILAGMLLLPLLGISQQIGTPQWMQAHQSSSFQRNAGPVYTPQNGNDTLSTLYNNTACGLNYTMGTVRLGQRFSPIGLPQPAGMNINIPSCANIDKVYLYTEVLGVTPAINATVTNPANVSSTYNMTCIGNSVDVCWGMNGTHVWRADVTSCFGGPGTYQLSGFPVSTTTAGVDVEGATLIFIYTDPTSGVTGSLILDDGCHTVTGGSLVHTMTGFTACANSTYGNAFMLVGDMQMTGYTLTMNGNAVTQPQWDWWNEISANTSVVNGQGSCSYTLNHSGDCYTLAVAGLYFQTGCQTCTPLSMGLTITPSTTAATCNNNGSASVSVTGGTGNYTYLWLPGGQTTSSVSNLQPGTYVVYVQDGVSCGSAVVTVANAGMSLSMSTTPSGCTSGGTATVSVSGGTGPFSYLWSPSGGTGATATGLSPGYYTCAVTDNGTGCTTPISDTVASTSSFSVNFTVIGDSSCSATHTGAATAYPIGGTGPFTYLWSPGGQTTQGITGLAAGTYSVSVTDNTGCTVSASVNVTNIGLSIYTAGSGYYSCGDSIPLYAWCSDSTATFSWSPTTGLNNPNIASPVSTIGTNITYTVTATSACGSVSDTVAIYIDTTNYHVEDICFVTVDTATNKNIVIWERNNSPTYGSYNIYRETAVSGVYSLIGSQPISQFSTFIDMTSNPQVMANRYVISTVDSCGYESDTSFHHRTIHLQTSPNGLGGWNLSWTAYEGLPISTYNIFRGASISTLTLLTQVAGNVFTYTDLTPPAGQNYYMIEAVHPYGGCQPSLRLAGPSQNPFDFNASVSNWSLADPNGIADNAQLENSLLITPNPGSGNFQLNMSFAHAQEIQVNVLDQLGQVVHTQQENAAAGNFTATMDLSQLASGVYIVQVKTATGTAMRRLVVQ